MSKYIYTTSYVYLFVMKNKSSFKIGKSDNPQHRFDQLRSKYEFKEQFYVINCEDSKKSYYLENLLHQTFSKFNIDCESREFFEYNVYQNVCDLITNFTNHTLELVDATKNKEPLGEIGLNKENIVSFRKLIKRKRKEYGYTQQELADNIGCTRQSISKIERDFNHQTSFKLYMLIADILKININLM